MIRLAIKRALQSDFTRAKVGAVISKGSRVLSTGYNHIGYSKYLPNRLYPESVHAEQQAILPLLRTRRLRDLVGATIYVTRVNRNGDTRLARPCEACAALIASVGIKSVVYTTNTGVEEYKVA